MPLVISDLKKEQKDLIEQKKRIEEKLEAIQRTISAYSNKKITSHEAHKNVPNFDFDTALKVFSLERQNKPFKIVDLVRSVLQKYPQLTERQVRSKITYEIRKKRFINQSYGFYILSEFGQNTV